MWRTGMPAAASASPIILLRWHCSGPAFAAHERRAQPLLVGLAQPLEARLERTAAGADLVVIHLAVRVAIGVARLAAERVAHEQVADAARA